MAKKQARKKPSKPASKKPTPPARPLGHMTITVRIPVGVWDRLQKAMSDRKRTRAAIWSQQAIAAEALTAWLDTNGF